MRSDSLKDEEDLKRGSLFSALLIDSLLLIPFTPLIKAGDETQPECINQWNVAVYGKKLQNKSSKKKYKWKIKN